ncbi:TonB-dependent hemoglobin/transferrin/lactoferrin family receptor [Bosea sp. (in: a-proteobacteria)]|uniref:TonB-dependent hemoglobin/transferrin/lactoferrin family receptor n=1 Tax=Bosea sp. (in: a-proteobacteria) TaxID=1871050 RepID=UPI00262D9478|nr:TonB-dependent hemoglobin/transferrin/lactoferrin family receptor [Bosea sp. (in: a-proteobacteria)]MCO5092219.1 TonB-dependent hemoglobin/transferrin/lactoferrin family receptor [Bosea sp. (in: a-proteobacteria)]
METFSGRLRGGVALGSLALALLASPADAQQQRRRTTPAPAPAAEAQVQLDQITVQGEGVPGGALLNGPTTTRMTREELSRQQIQSVADLSRRVEAGISFNRVNGSVNIRGLDGARVLTTVDGIRQPFILDNRIDRSIGTAFDFDSLSTLDLLRGGSGGATLGSGALGGALAVRTLDPEDLIRAGKSFGALAKTGYDSTDKAVFGSGAVAGRFHDTWVLLQGGFRKGNETDSRGTDPTIGAARTVPNPADFTQYSFLAKLHQYVNEVHRFGLTGEIFKREDKFQTRTNAVSLNGNYRPGAHQTEEEVERRRISLNYDYKQPGGFLDEAHASLYWQGVTRNSILNAYRFTSVIGPYARNNEVEEKAFGFNGHLIKSFITGPVSHKLTLGTELRSSELDQYSAGLDSCRRPYTGAFTACNNLHTNQSDTPHVEGKMAAFYAHHQFGFFNDTLRLTPGARFDWYEEKPKATAAYLASSSFAGMPASSSGDAWSPRVRLEYDIIKNAPVLKDVTLFAQWSKGFRAPTASELYATFGAVGTYLRSSNPDLRPETSNGIDVGFRFGDKAFGGSVTYFHTNYRNFIETVQIAPPGGLYPQGGIQGPQNVARAEISGVEANMQYAFAPNWLVRGSFAYVDGKNRINGIGLNSIPPVQGIFAIAYGNENWGGEVSTKLAGARKGVATTTSAALGTTQGFQAPGYAIFNAMAWWRPMPQIADLELQIGVYNIFDRKYWDAVTVPTGVLAQARDYYTEPGRTVKATLKYQF